MSTVRDLEELHRLLMERPELYQQWRLNSAAEAAYGLQQLHYSGSINPEVSREFLPHVPLFRCWMVSSVFGYFDSYSLTVFRSCETNKSLCRKANWRRSPHSGGLRTQWESILIEQKCQPIRQPVFEIVDVEIPTGPLDDILHRIAELRIPPISIQDPQGASVCSDSTMFGVAFGTASQPQATIRYEWSYDIPSEWKPVVAEFVQLRQFLEEHFVANDGENSSDPAASAT